MSNQPGDLASFFDKEQSKKKKQQTQLQQTQQKKAEEQRKKLEEEKKAKQESAGGDFESGSEEEEMRGKIDIGANKVKDIKEVKLPRYQDSGRCIGYAHITMKSQEAAQKALELTG